MNQYLRVNHSQNKELKLARDDRDHSINSNISQSFGYNNDNEDFAPFGQKNNMNLSKPQEINFDNLNINPNPSFVSNIINKISENSKPFNKQVSLTLSFMNYDSGCHPEFDNTTTYDLNQLGNSLNISLSRNKRVILEMIDDSHVQVKTLSK